MVRKVLIGLVTLVALISLLGINANAQNGRFEIIPAYSFMSNQFGDGRLGNHGYALDINYNFNDNIGLTASFSGNHGGGVPYSYSNDYSYAYHQTQDFVTGVFGPSFYHHAGNFRMFLHGLAGFSHGRYSVREFDPTCTSGCTDFSNRMERGTGFGLVGGGGLDYHNNGHWGWRIFQADYVFGNINADGLYTCDECTPVHTHNAWAINNVRVVTGLIFRFGGTR